MKQVVGLAESVRLRGRLPPSEENVQAAKIFVLRKWQERTQEIGREIPSDLSRACKFTSLFSTIVFGGQIRGNFFHQWAEPPNGKVLDLSDQSSDVAALKAGKIPEYARSHAEAMRQTPPSDLYAHNPRHIGRKEHRDSMASVRARVEGWTQEFLANRSLGNSTL